MKTSELLKLEPIVKRVLEQYPETRDDDFLLVYAVYREIDFRSITRELFCEIMMNHKKYRFPTFESVTRCRRKVQNKYPELASEKTKAKRLEETREYIDYAIDGYNPTFINMIERMD